MKMENPFGYGRIVREGEGDSVARIVEQKDATPEEAAIDECNAGFYCFDAQALFDGAFPHVRNDNAQGEYYLTDVLEICRNDGRDVVSALYRRMPNEAMGVNSRIQLCSGKRSPCAIASTQRHMAAGVTMWDPFYACGSAPMWRIENDVELFAHDRF